MISTIEAATVTAASTLAASTSSSFMTSLIIDIEEQQSVSKTLSSSDLQVIGWVLWAVILVTLLGNLCSFYAVFHYQNFKKIMTPGNPYLLSNVLCAALSLVDLCQIVMVGIPAAICFTNTNTTLASSLYNLGVVDPLLDVIVWTQLLLVTTLCLDRALHICRPITYYLKPYMMVLSLLISPALPFLTLTLPYIIAAQVTMRESESRGVAGKGVFLCSIAEIYDKEGNHVANIKVFMSCTLSLGTVYPWKHGEFYQTWEDVSHPLVLVLTVAALIGTCAVIIRILRRSAQFEESNSTRVAKSIRKTCTISIVQGVLILASSLPLRCYQIQNRLCPYCAGFSVYYIIIARLLVFLGPMFNPWLYSIRMGNVRNFLATKKDGVFNSARRVQMSLSSRVQMSLSSRVPSKSVENQTTTSKRYSIGSPHKSPGAVHKSPGGAYKSPGGAYRSPGAVHKSPGGAYKSPGGAYKSPGGAYKSPGAVHKSPGGAYKSPGVVHKSAGGAYKSPGGAYKSPGGAYKSPGAVHKSPGGAYKSPGVVHKSPGGAYTSPAVAYLYPSPDPAYKSPGTKKKTLLMVETV